MATPGFIPYPTTNIVGYSSERKNMSGSSAGGGSSSSSSQGRFGDPSDVSKAKQLQTDAPASSSSAVQELDTLYQKLSNASLALKNLDPTMPPPKETTHVTQPSSTKASGAVLATVSVDSGASSPSGDSGADTAAGEAVAEHGPPARGAGECDPECPCQKVILEASPGSCGLCGGRPEALAKQNDERLRAVDDLEIATQRINELAHEKARHVDYIADLETRVAEQAKKIDSQRDIVAGLKNDLSAMNDKFVDQVNMTAEIAHSRELVEAELEDLTQKLFTEANTMVAAEKKARFDAEKTTSHLRNIINDLEVRLANETMQSQELKERIEQMSAEYDDLVIKRTLVPSRRGSIGSHLSDVADVSSVRREGSVLNALGTVGSGSGTGAPGASLLAAHGDGFRLGVHAATVIAGTKAGAGVIASGGPIRLDDVLFAEFKEFATQTQSNRLTNYASMPFMKNVVSEDVEPCLRFGPRPRISVRNVLEAISTNRLQIEEMTQQVAAEMRRQQQVAERANGHRQAILWERFSGTVAYNSRGCQACGREGQCTYRFRMGVKADSEWVQIDTVCRDRLVAVCEFYGFVRYLRQGIFASRSVMDLYMETIRLRLCMFYARIGAYGYAIELDPNLAEATLLIRTPSMPPQPDSPSALSHIPSFGSQTSPLAAPYIHTQRAASAISVPWRETMAPASPSHLAADAAADHVNRNRSRSQEAPTTLSASGSISAPLQPTVSESMIEDANTAPSDNDSGDGSGSIASVHTTSPDVSRVTDHSHEPVGNVTGNTGSDDDDNMPIIQAINRNAQVDDDKTSVKTGEAAATTDSF